MANFLEDNSGIAAAGSAFNSFAESYQRAQDNQMKRLESQAQIEATKQKIQREKDQSQIDLMKSGYTKDAQGELQEAQLSPRQRGESQLKAIGEGVKATGFDDNGNPTGYTYDPNTPKAKQIEAMKVKFNTGNNFKQEGIDLRKDSLDRREHEKVLTRINSDPQAKQKLAQFSGINNAFAIINEADTLTPEQIQEFQQTIRSNLGMKGAGGVGEREGTYFKSMGLNAARMKEFLTGDPASISKDSKLVAHFKQLAGIEQANVRTQFDRALKSAASGHASMYGRRPDLYDDLMDSMSQHAGQLAPIESQTPQQPPPPQGGLVKPQGFLSRAAGLVFGSPADAGQVQSHPQDGAAVQWARANPKDPRAAAIIKANGP